MKRNNQRGAQRQVDLTATARSNRTLMGIINHMLSGAGHSVAECFNVKPPRMKYNRSKYEPHQGEQEKARRRRQIAAGTFTRSNGLYLGDIK